MKKKRIVVLFLAFICIVTALPMDSIASGKDFPDVKGHWAEKYILELADKGGIDGMLDGSFHPNDTVTFPQYVKIIIGSEYGEIPPVENGSWASGYMYKALEAGIIDFQDLENTEPITRNDAARIVANSLLYILSEEEAPDTSIVSVFEDYPTCKSCRGFFDTIIGQCYVKGIITGKPGPVFDGEANLTRAEACIIIMKMHDHTLRTPPEIIPEQSVFE